jgi:hypothetical protein
MKTPKPRLLTGHLLLVTLYFFAAGIAGVKVVRHERACSRLIDQIARQQDLNAVTNMDVNLNPGRIGKVTSFLLKITNKKFTNEATAEANRQEITDRFAQLQQEVTASGESCLALLGISILFVLGSHLGARGRPRAPERLIYDLLAVSLIFFAIGIYCPVLTASVKGEHMLVGGFMIETDSKGILSTVVTLAQSGNWIIGVLLAGFSIGIPIFKGIAVVVTLLQPSRARRARVGRILEAIGKWSLTDVMVAAVFLAVFSLNAIKGNNGGVVAVPRYALGFFICYCVLASFTSALLRRAAKGPVETPAPSGRTAVAALATVVAFAGGLSVGRSVPFPLWQRPPGLADATLLKLVRTQTEVIGAKYEVSAERPTAVAFTAPFAGSLLVQATSREGVPFDLSVVPDPGTPATGTVFPIKGLPEAAGPTYRHAAMVNPGRYRVVLRSAGAPQSVILHLTIEP